ncbi:Pls/PosA family non-ribosomal peptide synthetase [Corynebacterium sp. HS2168-gen11]|uniref:Pls/PosA family non-ribosomal peptide synthetase n=1 Tax=Corynebacterium sp. HS2168-gen11 TaxID=2974027 RepID=UPI00216AC96E|nr:Pls/PosA family non-ribosomal peptide synthetase [Corynebacterium sp. HS2168-gen11]MCS4536127.1 amino acid adenylation domain-containing protein [Corynebacterium sp. HS2168-gen11]
MSIPTIFPQYLRSDEASPPSSLIECFQATVHAYPDAAALDDGTIITYQELWTAMQDYAANLHALGIRRGDRIGVRLASGSNELYTAILGILYAGAAYVPVDADDPEERATIVFEQADVNAIITNSGITLVHTTVDGDTALPTPDDDAWIIFTSGSTGLPKGVAVTHRSAAAFVAAEAQLFCQSQPLGPDDRVLAGLSVAFDASCEEMWLAWAHGGCLVPAPRALVRSGMDLGPWLIRRAITVISTVPTLAGLWPAEALDQVRLLIFGGEACPPELVTKLATKDREVWNTYGPTEATVVACAARLYPNQEVSIGLPLAGWDLAVVDASGQPVAYGQAGELIIGGVGLARYLDPIKDQQRYAALPALGWQRAYRTGDHVRLEPDGLYFQGRLDDQVKIGGRRIELGEVESYLQQLDGIATATVVVQNQHANPTLVAYLTLQASAIFDHHSIVAQLRTQLPAALIPQLHVMDSLPVTTAGKVNKRALPWPLPTHELDTSRLTSTEAWLATIWAQHLGVPPNNSDDDFFALGGTSLAAALVVGDIRQRYPHLSVRELYDHPRLATLAAHLEATEPAPATNTRVVAPVPLRTRILQFLLQPVFMALRGTIWLTWLLLGLNLANLAGVNFAWHTSWYTLGILSLLFLTPPGRLWFGGVLVRTIMWKISPGRYPRGGSVHLRLWAAERLSDLSGVRGLTGSVWVNYYARILGVQIGQHVHLHTLPPVTGLLNIGDFAAIEPEVDLSGHWLDGDELVIGSISIGADARIGTRSIIGPDCTIGELAHIEAGSALRAGTTVPAYKRFSGSPAHKTGRAHHRFPSEHAPHGKIWVPIFGLSAMLLAALPLIAITAGGSAIIAIQQYAFRTDTMALVWLSPLGALIGYAVMLLAIWCGVRICSFKLRPGVFPVRSRAGWQIWCTTRLMDEARTWLFPLYAATLTPLWLRSLGATIGRNVEISTALLIPCLTTIKEGAFLADDTLIGGYELGGGWIRVEHSVVGKRSFLGNSSILGSARKLAKHSLIAVLSATPKKTKPHSNWWGSPPERMRRIVHAEDTTTSLRYEPPLQRKLARALIESLRLFAPMTAALLLTVVCIAMSVLVHTVGILLTALLSGVLLLLAGWIAAGITVAVKWLCVQRHRGAEHPLWSWFVWLNELQDTFIEVLAAPWLFQHALGTGSINFVLRLLGAEIGKGAWIESYWLPETDLCHIGAGASVGPGTVVQTHLFHDRIMSLDHVWLDDGATLGAHSVLLPAARLGAGSVIEPGSLVMRGDTVPAGSRWQGNPIEIVS